MHTLIRHALPAYGEGQRIGLLGGSFNPPHLGHRLVSEMALKRLQLDWVWWLVTPGNPLKDTTGLPSQQERMRLAAPLARHPRIRVTGIEAALRTRYTADTLERLADMAPGARFIWLMGGDNLIHFHRWERWRDIAHSVPMAIYDRPGYHLRAMASKAATSLRRWEIHEEDAPKLGRMGHKGPEWVYLTGPLSSLSSTALRAKA